MSVHTFILQTITCTVLWKTLKIKKTGDCIKSITNFSCQISQGGEYTVDKTTECTVGKNENGMDEFLADDEIVQRIVEYGRNPEEQCG